MTYVPQVPFLAFDSANEAVAGDAMTNHTTDPLTLQATVSALRAKVSKLYADPARHLTERTEDEVVAAWEEYLKTGDVDPVALEEDFSRHIRSTVMGALRRRKELLPALRPEGHRTALFGRRLCLEILSHWAFLDRAYGRQARELMMEHTRRSVGYGDEPPTELGGDE